MIKDKMIKYLDHKGVSFYELQQKSGLPQATLKRPGGLTDLNIKRFIDFAPDLNLDWLWRDEGDILRDVNNNDNNAAGQNTNQTVDMDNRELLIWMRDKDAAHARHIEMLQEQLKRQELLIAQEQEVNTSILQGLYTKLAEDVKKIPEERPKYTQYLDELKEKMESLQDLKKSLRSEQEIKDDKFEMDNRMSGMEEQMKSIESMMETIFDHIKEPKGKEETKS